MNCACVTCIDRVTSPPPQDPWVFEFVKALIEGRVEHIGNSPDGRPIYRRV